MIRTYIADIAPLGEPRCFDKLFARLSAVRQEKCLRYHLPQDRKLSLGAEILLQYGLSDLGYSSAEIRRFLTRIRYGPYGKPYIDGCAYFNLSHSGDFAVCAMSDVPVGVDIERVGSVEEEIAKLYFHRAETAYLSNQPTTAARQDAFFRLWTLKESLMKATGLGFSLSLDQFELRVGKTITVNHQIDEKTYYFAEYPFVKNCNGNTPYKLAVCAKQNTFAARARRISLADFT